MNGIRAVVVGIGLVGACTAGTDSLADMLRDAGRAMEQAGEHMDGKAQASDGKLPSAPLEPGDGADAGMGVVDSGQPVDGSTRTLKVAALELAEAGCNHSYVTRHRGQSAGTEIEVTQHYAVIETERREADVISALACGYSAENARDPDACPGDVCVRAVLDAAGELPPMRACTPMPVSFSEGKAYVRCGTTRVDRDGESESITATRYASVRVTFAR